MPRDDPSHSTYEQRDHGAATSRQPSRRDAPTAAGVPQSAGFTDPMGGLTLFVIGSEDLDAILQRAPALMRESDRLQRSRGAAVRGVRDDEFSGDAPAEVLGAEELSAFPRPNGNCGCHPNAILFC